MVNKLYLDIHHKLIKPSGDDFELNIQTELDLTKGIIGIFGGSGQGKSTLLQICAGITASSGSKVSWYGRSGNEFHSSVAESAPCVYQSQDVVLFEHLTVEQNLDFVLQHSNWSRNNNLFTKQEVVDWCGISDLLNQNSQSLSGGEKQRVGLARSLLSGKPVIILDEPFSALDWHNRMAMLQLVQQFKPKIRISHYFSESFAT